MKVNHKGIRAKNIYLRDHGLKGQKYKLSPGYYKQIVKNEDDSYCLRLFIEIKNTDENPFPMDISLEFETIFTFSEFESVDEIYNYLNLNAIQMIFPYMRTALTSIVTSALMPPLVLPIIDVRQFKDKN